MHRQSFIARTREANPALSHRVTSTGTAMACAIALICTSGLAAAMVPPDTDDLPATPAKPASAPATPKIKVTTVAPSASKPAESTKPTQPTRRVYGEVAVPFPHPMITEVLFAVPTGSAGDANRDGERSVNGDEFIEIVNPHDRPIELQGYMLTDSTSGSNQFRFVFPKLQLAPGASAVIFNGNDAKWEMRGEDAKHAALGNTRDAGASPTDAAAGFSGAWLFTASATKSGIGFANESDSVTLIAPGSVGVHRVWWGSGKPLGGIAALLDEETPQVKGASVQRESCAPDAEFRDHHEIVWSGETTLFSPGYVPGVAIVTDEAPATEATPPSPASTPSSKPPEKDSTR